MSNFARVHGLAFTIGTVLLFAFIGILLTGLAGMGVALIFGASAMSPLKGLIATACGVFLIGLVLQTVFSKGTPPY